MDGAHPGAATRLGDPVAEAILPDVRAAQRRIVSMVRVSAVLNGDGLALWRESGCGEWKATAAEIGRELELLEVTYKIVTAFRSLSPTPAAPSCAAAKRSASSGRT
ncbi:MULTISPECIES: hypothetical protein [unclassified Streptomyces]|uniref:hypothetical protein n=1 Tax=unclassified Streptomyces TaxID=2593676 RepID=UPI00093F5408|nr:hypothetical protein [Streptomyces sp. CB01883]OKJ80700.1 hypothetical protein AMK32_23250 [Streptomyces sp. CB01883]